MQRIATGVTALDEMIEGGVPEGGTILVVGRPGSGKTILAHQMMFHNARNGLKSIYMTTLAEPQIKVLKFQQLHDYFDESQFQKNVIYHDLGYILRKSGPQQAMITIDGLLQKHHPKLIVIDTIKTICDMIPNFTEFREFITDLSVRLATWGCTALILGEYDEREIEFRPESAISDGILYLSGTEDRQHQKRFLRILKMRGTAHPGGQNYFRITIGGIELFPRLNPDVSDQHYEWSSERVSTGVQELDEITGGGLPQGSVTLVSGATGTGKTTLALHFINAGLKCGQPGLFVSFEENPRQIRQTALLAGMDLDSPDVAEKFHVMHVSPIELDVDEHIHLIQKRAREIGAIRIAIDSISSIEIGIRDKTKYTDYIWALTDFFKSRGITLLLTHEIQDLGSVGEITKYGISYVADNLLQVRYLEDGYLLKRCMRVIKMRGSRHSNRLHELVIGNDGIRIADLNLA